MLCWTPPFLAPMSCFAPLFWCAFLRKYTFEIWNKILGMLHVWRWHYSPLTLDWVVLLCIEFSLEYYFPQNLEGKFPPHCLLVSLVLVEISEILFQTLYVWPIFYYLKASRIFSLYLKLYNDVPQERIFLNLYGDISPSVLRNCLELFLW